MVGVSNPIFRADPPAGRRFLAGFGAGLALATATLAGPLLVAAAVASRLPELVREVLLVALVLGFAVADLCNRTPHVSRQVPQRFARDLHAQPGRLGLIWAFDLGLMVTTQKTTSLLWIGLAGAVLAGPPGVVIWALVMAAALYWLGVAVLTVSGDRILAGPAGLVSGLGGWAITVRRLAGAAAMGVAALLVVALP
jgi:hypothetical protein